MELWEEVEATLHTILRLYHEATDRGLDARARREFLATELMIPPQEAIWFDQSLNSILFARWGFTKEGVGSP